jgi:hypothetical protein
MSRAMHPLRPAAMAVAVLWSAGATMPAQAEAPNATQKSGEIRGRVTYCATGGATGAVVHLPGKSFEARLGPSGDFTLYWVPVGRHSVAIEAPGRATHTIEDVVVVDRRITELADIAICRDADGDSVNENLDCNDNNANIHPGATESCDGIDNDCDGAVDEGCAICTDADHDGFFAQSGCGTAVDCNDNAATTRPGAAEVCDAVDNNCDGATDEEFDFLLDASNCGTCGNVCADRGPGLPAACSAGTCVAPPEPVFELCDNIDNGQVDEGYGVGTSCNDCFDPETQVYLGVIACTATGAAACVCP